MGYFKVDSLLHADKNAIARIIDRLDLGCSNCGWNEAKCDIHHILPKAKGGSDHPTNLTYICPNCHRLAHFKRLTNYVSIVEHVREYWDNFR